MIQWLADDLANGHASSAVGGGSLDHLEKQRLGEVVAAAGGVQEPAGAQDAHGAQVDLVVSAQRTRHRATCLRERRRIEYDGVEHVPVTLAIAQVVERVSLY